MVITIITVSRSPSPHRPHGLLQSPERKLAVADANGSMSATGWLRGSPGGGSEEARRRFRAN